MRKKVMHAKVIHVIVTHEKKVIHAKVIHA